MGSEMCIRDSATGETHTVREFVDLTFKGLGVELEWQGEKEKEKGVVRNINDDLLLEGLGKVKAIYKEMVLKYIKKNDVVVEVDKNYYRPTEVDLLIGDASKAYNNLGWKPKTKFEELVNIMTLSDFEKVIRRGY